MARVIFKYADCDVEQFAKSESAQGQSGSSCDDTAFKSLARFGSNSGHCRVTEYPTSISKRKRAGGLRHSFDIKIKGVTCDVSVDAADGKVLENAKEHPHPDRAAVTTVTLFLATPPSAPSGAGWKR